eukprot:GABV01000377.1.p1 GENE.GABV01000377.1~~GABV01000377.1.p1  ORF type:complete len:152 (-),score=42.46 GABV01000377.1:392-847(-)
MSQPATPMARAVDALKPDDPAIGWIRKGGVTTSLVLPGSGNVFGGEAVIVKHILSHDIRDLLIEAPRAMKMACGENPKGVYGRGRTEAPYSRMGVIWEMRKNSIKLVSLWPNKKNFAEMKFWCKNAKNLLKKTAGRRLSHTRSNWISLWLL